mgnify:CR=1 FL=1
MFRMGGTPRHEFQEQTSGILSGLDGPKLNASRTGYENGGLTMEDFKKDVLEQADLRREILGEEDYNPENLHTEAKVTFEDGAVTKVHLTLTGKVPECSEEEFLKLANKAKENCPISKLLKAEITLDASLES